MLVLRSSPFSPFVRKVVIAAHLVGIADRLTLAQADPMNAADDLRGQNPLGKIPVLLVDGKAIYDSSVIVGYLDHLDGRHRLIPAGDARFETLTLEALADGIMDAAVILRYETTMREESQRSQRWVDHQKGKVARGLAALAAAPPKPSDRTVGAVAVACALGYLDFRFEGAWRAEHPALVAWLDSFAAAVPAFAETTPVA
jgi:glutathione S-transferase